MTVPPHRKPRTVDEYLADVPASARGQLGVLRETIAKAAPGAQEGLSHNILAFRHGGLLVAYAAFTRHLGFYPRASTLTAFRSELAGYATAKGTVQFTLGPAAAAGSHCSNGAVQIGRKSRAGESP